MVHANPLGRQGPHTRLTATTAQTPTTAVEVAGLAALLLAAVTAYCWDLDIQQWGNAYYSAVAQTGALSWKSLLFGSLEAGNVVSSDKPPAAFWMMALSVRTFGLSGWSLMLPQVAESAAMIVVLHRTVRRLDGPLAAAVAAAALATTPVVLALARYNHPDTLMTLMAVLSAYCCVRAAQSDRRVWLVAMGAALGGAFLSKWGAALLPAPGLLAAMVAARRRSRADHIRRCAVVVGAAALSSLWWVVLALVVPAADRPYPDASGGSVLQLIVGRDGFGRLQSGALGPAPGNPVSATAGVLRLFGRPFSGQISWLLPLALALLLVQLLHTRVRLRTGDLLFGGWLVTTLVVFSFMSGSMHPYYSLLMAPAMAAVVGSGVARVVRQRRVRLAVVLAVGSAAYAIVIMRAYNLPGWAPWTVTALTAMGVGWLVVSRVRSVRPAGRTLALVAIPLTAALVLGPVVFGVATIRRSVTGSDPLAGPMPSAEPFQYPAPLLSFLRANRRGETWLAAVPRATAASLLQLQSRTPVLPLGGFTGHTASPTLAEVTKWVDEDRLRYLVLLSAYGAYPNATPAYLRGFPIADILGWARRTGCLKAVPAPGYEVIDLDGGPCSR
jgi:4-amino-4-deoxy-L-arabinose transferase-like glycosyltransferase